MKLLVSLLLLVIAVTSYAQDARKDYIVSMKGKPYIEEIPTIRTGIIKEKLPATHGYLMSLNDAEVEEIKQNKRVKYIEEDLLISLESRQIQYPTFEWNLDRIDDRLWEDTNNSTYEYDYTGQGVDIYIIDSGIFKDDPEFEGRAVRGYGRTPTFGCSTHGHGVASVAGGRTHGVAKQVRLVDVHVFPCNQAAPISDIIKGVDYIIKTAKRSKRHSIANMSFGVETTRSFALEDATRQLFLARILPVIAAGNFGIDACNTSPAAVKEGLVVSGFMSGDNGWGFNNSPSCQNCGFNWGSCVDLYAPGLAGARWIDVNNQYRDGAFGGTSYAAPHGAGVAALYWEANPDATVQQVHDAIIENATPNALYNFPSSIQTPNLILYSLWDGS